MSAPLTYLYCLVRSGRRPSLRGAPDAISPGEPLRILDAGDGIWALASSVPASEFNEAALARGLQHLEWVGRHAVAHEAVVEHFLTARAVLPMQLFTLFTSDERALQYIRQDRRRIGRILSRIERRLEWGLRLTFDEKAAREAVERAHVETGRRASSSGSTYLARKRDLLAVDRVQLADAKAAAERLYRNLAREASGAKRQTATERAAPGSRLLLDAAFLVPVRRSASFRASLRKQARAIEAAGLVVSLTGPWPPYNFIDTPAGRTRGDGVVR